MATFLPSSPISHLLPGVAGSCHPVMIGGLRDRSGRRGQSRRVSAGPPSQDTGAMADRTHVLAIDVGTQSTRAALVDPAGRVRDRESAALPLSTPRPGWSEQAPEDWWRSAVRVVRALLDRNRDAAVDAVGVGAQMHGVVPLD